VQLLPLADGCALSLGLWLLLLLLYLEVEGGLHHACFC
jgi:hypothetical protein